MCDDLWILDDEQPAVLPDEVVERFWSEWEPPETEEGEEAELLDIDDDATEDALN